ncbi:hypothetical protein [Bacillus sp. CECT 9360]|nr:hypothetical protein [Bacillus sp. CECT 9360]
MSRVNPKPAGQLSNSLAKPLLSSEQAGMSKRKQMKECLSKMKKKKFQS